MVVPRVRVGCTLNDYELVRQDLNETLYERIKRDGAEKVREEDRIQWRVWPPKLVETFSFGWFPPPSIPLLASGGFN